MRHAILLPAALISCYTASAQAVLTGSQTAAVGFAGLSTATYGNANEAPASGYIGNCPDNNCFLQNGVVVGVVGDPTDAGAHIHRTFNPDSEAEYHTDSTGVYVRMDDLSNFSLNNINLNVTFGVNGGNFVLYGFANAINAPLLSSAGSPNPTDPEGGLIPHIASYLIPNDGIFNGDITFAELAAIDADWGNIGAFWLTFQGFNHSPTTNYWDHQIVNPGTDEEYAVYAYPDWNIRVDNIVLAAPVPLPSAFLQFAMGLTGLLVSNPIRRKKIISCD